MNTTENLNHVATITKSTEENNQISLIHDEVVEEQDSKYQQENDGGTQGR